MIQTIHASFFFYFQWSHCHHAHWIRLRMLCLFVMHERLLSYLKRFDISHSAAPTVTGRAVSELLWHKEMLHQSQLVTHCRKYPNPCWKQFCYLEQQHFQAGSMGLFYLRTLWPLSAFPVCPLRHHSVNDMSTIETQVCLAIKNSAFPGVPQLHCLSEHHYSCLWDFFTMSRRRWNILQ